MASTDKIRAKIMNLYKTNPQIHVNTDNANSKLNISKSNVKLVGVYKNIFQVEEDINGEVKRHTLLYTDVLINQVKIVELG